MQRKVSNNLLSLLWKIYIPDLTMRPSFKIGNLVVISLLIILKETFLKDCHWFLMCSSCVINPSLKTSISVMPICISCIWQNTMILKMMNERLSFLATQLLECYLLKRCTCHSFYDLTGIIASEERDLTSLPDRKREKKVKKNKNIGQHS